MWFQKRKASSHSEPHTFQLTCADIPSAPSRNEEADLYPQKSKPVPVHAFGKVVARYSADIRSLLNNIALSEDDQNRLVLPLIGKLIRLVHLLPASESHHHSGQGGLLAHSLECAGAALRHTKSVLFDGDSIPEVKYRNQTRWQIAGICAALLHDVGKVCNIVVTDNQGNVWNPENSLLLDWLVHNGSETYYVDWRSDREHKDHERYALRFAYRYLMHDELVWYLSDISGSTLINAIDNALLGTGPLAATLKFSDSQSIAIDVAKRKRISSDLTYISSPLLTPIISAMASNIASGLWKVNAPEAMVYVIEKSVFIRADPRVGTDIRSACLTQGASGIPFSTESIVKILADAGFVPSDATGLARWQTLNASGKRICCFEFLAPDRLFKTGKPAPCSATLVLDREIEQFPGNTPSMIDADALIPEQVDYAKLATENRAADPDSETGSGDHPSPKDQSSHLSELALNETLKHPFNKEQCRNFVGRLLNDLTEQMRCGCGCGNLVPNLTRLETGEIRCSSQSIERIADNHKISSATLDALIFSLSFNTRLTIDWPNHFIFYKELA